MTKGKQSDRLERKLAGYALAGAAVLAPGVAKAGTITSMPLSISVPQGGSAGFNLSGSTDFTLLAQLIDRTPFGIWNEVNVGVSAGAQTFMSGGAVADLAFGALIDPSAPGVWGSGGKLVGESTTGGTSGLWPTNGSGYLGFYFQGTDGPQAGWAHLATFADTTTSSVNIDAVAFETRANTAISAGDLGEATATPEPSTLALLAIGGAGLIAMRRRRSTNV